MRFNLCRACWKKYEPEFLARRQDVKARRRAKLQEEPFMSELATPPDDPVTIDAAIRIEEIRRNGVPAIGTPERAQYMRLFRRKQPESAESEPLQDRGLGNDDAPVMQAADTQRVLDAEPEPGDVPTVREEALELTPETRSEIAHLYADPTIPMAEIRKTYGIESRYTVERIAREAGIPKRITVLKERRRAKSEQREEQPVETQYAEPRPRIPVPSPDYLEGLWSVTYTLRRTEVVSAASIDDAIHQVRQHQGSDVRILGASYREKPA